MKKKKPPIVHTKITYASAILMLLLVFGALILRHHHTVVPNNRPPSTGVSIVFNPALVSPAKLEVESSDGKVIESATLARAKVVGGGHFIEDPQGIRYNIPLAEGVYRLIISSTTNSFPPFNETATVSNNKLTTENISFR